MIGVDIFAEAKRLLAAEVARRHHVTLNKRGRYDRGECPLCGAGEGGGEPFQAENDRDAKGNGRLFYCHSCQVGGDAIELEVRLGGHADTIEPDGRGGERTVTARVLAARVLAGVADHVERERERPQRRRREPPPELVDSLTVADFIWSTALPARGTIVEAWLRARGLDPFGVPAAIDRLRFHPRCPVVPWRVGANPSEAGLFAPAMIAPMERVSGPAWNRAVEWCGVHATYLRGDGGGKADLPRRRDGGKRQTRKMWGEAGRAGFWLTPIDVVPLETALERLLLAGEGIETVWSEAERRPGARAVAVLSLQNLQGGLLRDAKGAIPLWSIRGDPEKSPVTIEDAGDVIVLVDADMAELKPQWVQHRKAGPRTTEPISPLLRSRICAHLATAAWTRAGATSARAIRPPMGMDFNDFRGGGA